MKRHAAAHRGIQTRWQEPAYHIEPRKLQYPLPQRELALNPDLEQNSGRQSPSKQTPLKRCSKR